MYITCDNAIKYNKDNGKITVFVGESAKRCGTVRKDTGMGIPKIRKRIFERFYRVDKATQKSQRYRLGTFNSKACLCLP